MDKIKQIQDKLFREKFRSEAMDYTYRVYKDYATIIGHRDMDLREASIPETITDDFGTYKVTSIRTRAFCNRELEKIEIPAGVKSIGSEAFIGCKYLKRINAYSMLAPIVGKDAFSGLSSETVLYVEPGAQGYDVKPWSNFNIISKAPDGDEYTVRGEFANYEYTTQGGHATITKCIRFDVFMRIPDVITNSLGTYDVTAIGDYAFDGCFRIGSINIPKGVTSIGVKAFAGCGYLNNVDAYPMTAPFVGNGAFDEIHTRAILCVQPGATGYDSKSFPNFFNIVRRALDKIEYKVEGENAIVTGSTCYIDCIPSTITDSLGTYTVTAIGDYAFERYRRLRSIEIPEGVTSIGKMAFYDCEKLSNIYLHPMVAPDIGSGAFAGAWNPRLHIHPGAIGYDVKPWSSFEIVEIPPRTSDGYVYELSGNDAKIIGFIGNGRNIKIPTLITDSSGTYNVTTIGEDAFYDCAKLKSVIIPRGIVSIDRKAFYYCKNLKSVEIADTVTSIGYMAFSGCKSLEKINIPNSVTSIEGEAFRYCESLTEVKIPNSVTSIGYSAFSGCTRLKKINIPAGITVIGCRIFGGCIKLNTIIAYPMTAPTLLDNAFGEEDECSEKKVLYINSGATGYDAEPWSNFKQYMLED